MLMNWFICMFSLCQRCLFFSLYICFSMCKNNLSSSECTVYKLSVFETKMTFLEDGIASVYLMMDTAACWREMS